MPALLYVADIASLLGIDEAAVRKRCRREQIPGAFKECGRWAVRRVTFDNWLKAREAGIQDWRP